MCLGNSHPVHPNADFNICGVPEMSDAIEAARLEREGECALSGYLFKKARGKSTGLLGTILHPGTLLHDHSWKERDFYLYSTRQLVYIAGAGEVKGIFDLTGAVVDKLKNAKHLPEGARCAIDIKNKDGEVLSLAADADWRLDKWVAEIRAIVSGEWKPEDVHKSTPAAKGLAKQSMRRHSRKSTLPHVAKKLNDYMKGQTCADCGATRPIWATVNIGVLVCTACSGVHRSLGVQTSFVKSVTMDLWSDDQATEFIEGKGGPNEALNRVFEYHVPAVETSTESGEEDSSNDTQRTPSGYYKPHSTSSRALRERFIKAKYADRTFYGGSGMGKDGGDEREALAPVTDPSPHSADVSEEAPFIGFLVVKPLSLRLLSPSSLDTATKKEPCPWFVEVATGKQFLDNKDHKRAINDAGKGKEEEGDDGGLSMRVTYTDSALLLGWSGISPLRFKLLSSCTKEKDRTSSSSHKVGPGSGHSHAGKLVGEACLDLCDLPDYEQLEQGEDVMVDIKLLHSGQDMGLLHSKVSFVPG